MTETPAAWPALLTAGMLVSPLMWCSQQWWYLDIDVVLHREARNPEACLDRCSSISPVRLPHGIQPWKIALTCHLLLPCLYGSSCAWARGSCIRWRMRRNSCMAHQGMLHHSGPRSDRISLAARCLTSESRQTYLARVACLPQT
jgi:hypothetical protein